MVSQPKYQDRNSMLVTLDDASTTHNIEVREHRGDVKNPEEPPWTFRLNATSKDDETPTPSEIFAFIGVDSRNFTMISLEATFTEKLR